MGTGFTLLPPCPGTASRAVALLLPHMPIEELLGAGESALYSVHGPCCQGIWRASPHGSCKPNTCGPSWEPPKSVPAAAPAASEPTYPMAKPPACWQPIPGWSP